MQIQKSTQKLQVQKQQEPNQLQEKEPTLNKEINSVGNILSNPFVPLKFVEYVIKTQKFINNLS